MKEPAFCSSCGFIVGRNDQVVVSKDSKMYCYKNNCSYGIPEGVEVEIKEAYINEAFCAMCGKLVPAERRKPDINSRVFCSEDHKADYYGKVCVCSKCGVEI
ncbi:MAG: hypothetical protein WA063_00555 [Minisyncoccia bacterium]